MAREWRGGGANPAPSPFGSPKSACPTPTPEEFKRPEPPGEAYFTDFDGYSAEQELIRGGANVGSKPSSAKLEERRRKAAMEQMEQIEWKRSDIL